MFDVTWNDPSTEKVGERKARKEKERELKEVEDAQHSKRGSTSTRRSSSSADKSVMTKSTGGKSSSWFGGVGLRKNRLSTKSKVSHPSELRIPIPEASTVTPSLPTASTFGSTFSASSFLDDIKPDSKTNSGSSRVHEPRTSSWDELENAQNPQTRESRLSRTTQVNGPSLQSREEGFAVDLTGQPSAKAVQTLGKDRWIMKTTETVVETHTEADPDRARPGLTVSAERALVDPHTAALLTPLDRDLSTHTFPSSTYVSSDRDRAGIHTPSRPPAPKHARNKAKSPVMAPPITGRVKFRAHDPSRWKAPDEWEVEEQPTRMKGFNGEEPFSAVERPGNDTMADLASVQREIKKMALLVPASLIFRMDEKLSDSSNPSAYKETEMEKKRLMLYALYALGRPRETQNPPNARKMLALFETEATASFLAAIYPESSITHVSASPLSAQQFPNVRPLASPTVARSALPLSPNYFSAVYCLPLASALPGQEIPGLLRSIHSCLSSGGILHLVLINPAPAATSVGPRMRQWIEDNLLLNLEQKFRCTNPRKLVPLWLGDAGLRVKDSTKTTVKCRAVFQKMDSKERRRLKAAEAEDDDEEEGEEQGILDLRYGGHGPAKREKQAIERELQSRIGRILWQDTWGSHVNAGRWWWDDPACAAECAQLGTYWEYSVIEAVKER